MKEPINPTGHFYFFVYGHFIKWQHRCVTLLYCLYYNHP